MLGVVLPIVVVAVDVKMLRGGDRFQITHVQVSGLCKRKKSFRMFQNDLVDCPIHFASAQFKCPKYRYNLLTKDTAD